MTESDSRTQAVRRQVIVTSVVACAVLSVLSIGCDEDMGDKRGASSQGGSTAQDVEALKRSRSEKDAFLREAKDSPISPEERSAFTGLRYFPPDPTFVVAADFEPFPTAEPVSMMMTNDDPVTMLRAGLFTFRIDGESVKLTAYKNPEQPGRLFLPFRDATNGELTYWAGRYLDVNEASGSTYLLDFNYAYSPYCAYNHAYSCPVVPLENILDVAVRAGELTYGEYADKRNR